MLAGEELRFVALGDSTTVGVGDRVTDGSWLGWSRLLAAELAKGYGVHYENFAVSCATAATVRHDQLQQAAARQPHLASLLVGVNDTMRATWDPDRLRSDVLATVAELADAGALVLTVRFHDHGAVFGLPGFSGGRCGVASRPERRLRRGTRTMARCTSTSRSSPPSTNAGTGASTGCTPASSGTDTWRGSSPATSKGSATTSPRPSRRPPRVRVRGRLASVR